MGDDSLFVDLTHDEILALLSAITVILRKGGRKPDNVPKHMREAATLLEQAEVKLIATHNIMIDLGL